MGITAVKADAKPWIAPEELPYRQLQWTEEQVAAIMHLYDSEPAEPTDALMRLLLEI